MTDAATTSLVTADQLRSFIERFERLAEEKKALVEDMKEVFAEAKSAGFDTKIMRQVIRLRRMNEADRHEQEELLNVYMRALGMLADTPLGEAALRAVRDC